MNSYNRKMDYQSYKLCDRCKCQQVVLNCASCSPFQNFCSKCDTDVHTLPSKMKHRRIPLSQQSSPSNPSESQSPRSNSIPNQNIVQPIQQQPCQSTDNALFYYPSANLSFLETKQSDQRATFTKDYVNELKAIHQKEKAELLFKLNSMQASQDRLKASFGEHINKMQVTVEESNKANSSRLRQNEEENDFKIKKLFHDKDNLIAQLKKDNDELLNSNAVSSQSLSLHDKKLAKIKDAHSNQLSSLSNQLNRKQNEIDTLKQESILSCEALEKEAKENIMRLTSAHEAKLNEISLQYHQQLASLKDSLDSTSRELFIAKEKQEECRREADQHIGMLKEDNVKLRNELQSIQDQSSAMFLRLKQTEADLNSVHSENDIAMKMIERQKSDIIRKDEQIIFLENSITALKHENDLFRDKNCRLQNDYTRMCSHTDSMTYEYETKIKSLNHVEDKNFVLERENCELKNRIGRMIRPYAFNK